MNIDQKLKNISSIENNNSYIIEQINNAKLFINITSEYEYFKTLNPLDCLNNKKYYPFYFLFVKNDDITIQDGLKIIAEKIKQVYPETKIRFLKDIETNMYRVEINFIFIGYIIEHNSSNNPLFYLQKEFYFNLITKSNFRKINNNIYWENILFKNDKNRDDTSAVMLGGLIETNGIQTDWSGMKIVFLNENDYTNETDEILSTADYWYKSLIKRDGMYIFIVKHDFQYIMSGQNKIFTYYGQLFLLNYLKLINLVDDNEYDRLLNEILNRGERERLGFVFGEKIQYYGGEYDPYFELKEREWNRIKIESFKF
jgi:hypothetical protein